MCACVSVCACVRVCLCVCLLCDIFFQFRNVSLTKRGGRGANDTVPDEAGRCVFSCV